MVIVEYVCSFINNMVNFLFFEGKGWVYNMFRIIFYKIGRIIVRLGCCFIKK